MTFQKTDSPTAYATGGIRTNLDLPLLITTLKRQGLGAETVAGKLHITCGGETWIVQKWQSLGLGRIGWFEAKPLGDVATFSRALARMGLRHRFEYSRPMDLATNDLRFVTAFEYRWEIEGLAPRAHVEPRVTTFEERV